MTRASPATITACDSSDPRPPAPTPHRGRVNAPYLVPHTVRAMAQVRGVSVHELCRALSDNSEAVYGPW